MRFFRSLLVSFLVIVAASSSWAWDDTGSKSRKSAGANIPGKLAEVAVSSAQAIELGPEARWTEIPAYLQGAKVYAKDPTGRELDLTVKSDGLLIIAVSWTYDGNESGGWVEGRTTREQLEKLGWTPLDNLVWMEKDTHTIFVKPAKAGDKLKFHTRKYNQPFLIEPPADKVATIVKKAKERSEATASQPAVASSTNPPAPTPPPSPPPPNKQFANLPVSVKGAEPAAIVADEWNPLPDYLRGAIVLRSSTNILELSVERDVQVLVAASWAYDGNRSGGWYEGRKTLTQLVRAGWDPVGTIVQKDRGEHTLMRRTLKAGQKGQFHTRKHNPPVLLIPTEAMQKVVAALPRLVLPTNNLAGIDPPEPRPSSETGPGVVLRTHEPDREDRFVNRGTLLREIVRQAILLAAREELQLPTRDNSLRERSNGGPKTAPEPLDCVVNVQEGGTASITVFRFRDGKPDILWDDQVLLKGDDQIVELTTLAEQLARNEFVAALRKAGKEGTANKVVVESTRTGTVHANLADLHPLSQFAAARELHDTIHREGESPERLADLARVYANLGVLTEHLWYSAPKVFKARALLYAERGMTRWPNSHSAICGRAYARALVGLHQAALDDISTAKAIPGLERKQEWVELPFVERFCRFELAKLDGEAIPPRQLPLVKLLKLLSVERYTGTANTLTAAQAFLEAVPDSDRAINAVFETYQLGTEQTGAALGLQRTPEHLYARLAKVGELPRQAEALVERAAAAPPSDEHNHRLKLIRALREGGELGADEQEPSWQAVAAWIEEVAFLQATRQMEFLENGLSVPLDEARQQLEPLVADHPYRTFFASLCDGIDGRRTNLALFAKQVRLPDVSMNESFLWTYLSNHGFPEGGDFYSLAFKHQDWIYRDLQRTVKNAREFSWPRYAGHLRRVAPYSPFTIAATAEYDWEFAEPKAKAWEEQYVESPQVQGALGRQYVKQKKYDDAVRCLKRQTAMLPEYQSYAELAEAWMRQSKEEEWLATWKEYLTKDDEYGLTRARAEANVAEYYMQKGQWEDAWPYAETAADTGSQWGMTCAADCLTGLKRWEEAEQYMRVSARRYPETAPEWYFWCKRNQRGSEAVAKDFVLQVLANPQIGMNQSYRAVFLTLEGKKDEALVVLQESLGRVPSSPTAWHAAILADELKKPELRDQLLQTAHQTADRYERPHLAALAKIAADVYADKSKQAHLVDDVVKLVNEITIRRERCLVAYLGAHLLLSHGEDEPAMALLENVASVPYSDMNATLAAVELRQAKEKKNTDAPKTTNRADE